jgi:hypothetical protein
VTWGRALSPQRQVWLFETGGEFRASEDEAKRRLRTACIGQSQGPSGGQRRRYFPQHRCRQELSRRRKHQHALLCEHRGRGTQRERPRYFVEHGRQRRLLFDRWRYEVVARAGDRRFSVLPRRVTTFFVSAVLPGRGKRSHLARVHRTAAHRAGVLQRFQLFLRFLQRTFNLTFVPGKRRQRRDRFRIRSPDRWLVVLQSRKIDFLAQPQRPGGAQVRDLYAACINSESTN